MFCLSNEHGKIIAKSPRGSVKKFMVAQRKNTKYNKYWYFQWEQISFWNRLHNANSAMKKNILSLRLVNLVSFGGHLTFILTECNIYFTNDAKKIKSFWRLEVFLIEIWTLFGLNSSFTLKRERKEERGKREKERRRERKKERSRNKREKETTESNRAIEKEGIKERKQERKQERDWCIYYYIWFLG
jgi:hypothetical protein